MQQLLNRHRLEAANVIANLPKARIGIVDTFDPETYTCVVRYQPEDPDNKAALLSPALPIMALSIGNGFGLLTPPNIGDQVIVNFVGNSKQVGYVVGALFNDVDIAPETEAGGFYMIHQSGSFLKFTKDGKVNLNGAAEIDMKTPKINIITTGNVDLTVGGNLTSVVQGSATIKANGAATLSSTTSASVTAPSVTLGDGTSTTGGLTKYDELKAYIDNHVHKGVSSGIEESGTPTTTLPIGSKTNIVKGS